MKGSLEIGEESQVFFTPCLVKHKWYKSIVLVVYPCFPVRWSRRQQLLPIIFLCSFVVVLTEIAQNFGPSEAISLILLRSVWLYIKKLTIDEETPRVFVDKFFDLK